MFHHFHDEDRHIKGQGSINMSQFRSMIVWLKENFNLLSADEWYKNSIENKLQPNDICITFDDNLKCQFDIAVPVLEEFNLKAFWFIYTSPLEGVIERLEIYRYFRFSEFSDVNDFYYNFNSAVETSKYANLVKEKLRSYDATEFLKHFSFYTEEDKIFRFVRDQALGVERYYEIMDLMIERSGMDLEEVGKDLWNNAAQIQYLDETGHIIGLHSHTHPTELKHKSVEGQREEYEKCYSKLSAILEKDIKTMSHPCNSYNADTLEILKSMEVNFGFRSNMEDGFNSTLEYPRLDHALLIDKI